MSRSAGVQCRRLLASLGIAGARAVFCFRSADSFVRVFHCLAQVTRTKLSALLWLWYHRAKRRSLDMSK